MTIETSAPLPRSAQAGPEMAALAPFYKDRTWSGVIEAGGMGPGSPAMTGAGSARFERLAAIDDPDVRWIVRQNLRKARLRRLDAGWVERMRAAIGTADRR